MRRARIDRNGEEMAPAHRQNGAAHPGSLAVVRMSAQPIFTAFADYIEQISSSYEKRKYDAGERIFDMHTTVDISPYMRAQSLREGLLSFGFMTMKGSL